MGFKYWSANCLLALFLVSPAHADLAPEEILRNAALYTVKVKTLGDIGLNKDEGGSSTGTGFLIDRKRGWILTNAHVATRSPAKIEVSFKDGAAVTAKRIHVDAYIDMAVLQIPVSNIPNAAIEAKLSCGDLPSPGTPVLAYGHPWSIPYTATRGIVSGVSWFYPHEHVQTDALINSGNSGGPLINASNGQVVGINTATYSDKNDANASAVSLAEPMPAICRVISLLRDGKDARLKLLPLATATSGDDIKPRVARAYADNAQFQPGDLIVKVNGSGPVRSLSDLIDRLRGAGERATITVERRGKSIDIETPLQTKPDPLKNRSVNISGMVISNPWKLDDHELNPEGYLVIDWIEDAKEAALTEAKVSDSIVSVDGQKFRSTDALYSYLAALKPDAQIDLVLRGRSKEPEYFMEYRQVTLSRAELELIRLDE